MSETTCPNCGAPEHCRGAGVTVWRCGSGSDGMRGWNCERWVALRVSQLRRMERSADQRADQLLDLDAEDDGFSQGFYWRWFGRFVAFRDACRRELNRLRGQA